MKRVKFTFLTILILGLLNVNANAEYCNMIGDAGAVRWIYVPRTQYNFLNDKTEIKDMEGKVYKYEMRNRLFRDKTSLPLVNDVVTLNVNIQSSEIPSCMQLQNCRTDTLEHFKKINEIDGKTPILYNKDGTAEINSEAYQGVNSGGRLGDWDINKDAKLRIMGYQYIDGILFALVQIESC